SSAQLRGTLSSSCSPSSREIPLPLRQELARIIAVQGFRAIAFITKSLRLIAGRAEAARTMPNAKKPFGA
ncbi:MAG: hypothetical protein J4O01_05240, partial [Chloroflexi bacterium]|nr:hypothetical protein [Chloroflexota bacterium]